MKKYKAVIIDGRRIAMRLAAAAVCALAVGLIVFGIKMSGKGLKFEFEKAAENIIGESVPVVAAADGNRGIFDGKVFGVLKKGMAFVLTFDPYDMRTAIFGEIPLIKVTGSGYLAAYANGDAAAVYNPQSADTGGGEPQAEQPPEGQYPIKEVDSSQAKALSGSRAKIFIRNDTDYSVDIDSMLADKLTFDMKGSGPKVLILHTHATESYTPEGAAAYDAAKSDRSQNLSENIVRVGEEMKNIFEQNGIETIHDTTLHDYPNFNGSYGNSLKTAEMYKAKYPSIRVVLDIHRDSFVYDDGTKAKFVTNIDGKKAAQLMLVVGTNAGGLEHPDWRENMKFALKLQTRITDKYPTLMRGVNLRKERFNGHTTHGSLIIEVGSSGNTLNEALVGAGCAASEIAAFLNTLK